jgi:hypothetical protein
VCELPKAILKYTPQLFNCAESTLAFKQIKHDIAGISQKWGNQGSETYQLDT